MQIEFSHLQPICYPKLCDQARWTRHQVLTSTPGVKHSSLSTIIYYSVTLPHKGKTTKYEKLPSKRNDNLLSHSQSVPLCRIAFENLLTSHFHKCDKASLRWNKLPSQGSQVSLQTNFSLHISIIMHIAKKLHLEEVLIFEEYPDFLKIPIISCLKRNFL